MPTDVRPFFASRPVVNATEVLWWATRAGIVAHEPADELHVTLAFSREPVDWATLVPEQDEIVVPSGSAKTIEALGAATAVLRFESEALARRWQYYRDQGASWDHDGFKPHVTLSYGEQPAPITDAYTGPLILGPERIEPVRQEKFFKPPSESKSGGIIPSMNRTDGPVLKVDEEQRVVYGWASVIEDGGNIVTDTQGHQIEPATLTKAAHQFVLDERAGKVMHKGKRVADVVESVVFTADVQKALGVDMGKVGWFIGMKIRDDALWARVKAGDFPAFSIGGHGIEEPVA